MANGFLNKTSMVLSQYMQTQLYLYLLMALMLLANKLRGFVGSDNGAIQPKESKVF